MAEGGRDVADETPRRVRRLDTGRYIFSGAGDPAAPGVVFVSDGYSAWRLRKG